VLLKLYLVHPKGDSQRCSFLTALLFAKEFLRYGVCALAKGSHSEFEL